MGIVATVGEERQDKEKVRERMEALLAAVIKPTKGQTLDDVEREVFAGVLEIGRLMLGSRLAVEAAQDTATQIVAGDGQVLPYHSRKEIVYRSVFGEVKVDRAYYWKAGCAQGYSPLDARMNFPRRKDSYLLQEWALRMGVSESFDRTQEGLKELLKIEVPKRQLETYARETGEGGREFYDKKEAPQPKEKGPLLVAEADGKGVPMKKSVPAETVKRLTKGQKRDKKKMAWAGVVYTTAPRRGENKAPRPLGKEVFAEIARRERFGQELFDRAADRQEGVRRKAFLGDGQREIWEIRKEYFPDYEEILDWMHASEYLWKAAHLFLPESSPKALAWVERQQKRFRHGGVKDVIREIEKLARDGTIRGKQKQEMARKIANYYRHNRHRMRYDRYRRLGFPIGTGAVEGTCRYLIKDRMERSGMRWTVNGAQAILTLRGIFVSEHWQRFWEWYRASEAERLYGNAAVVKIPAVGVAA